MGQSETLNEDNDLVSPTIDCLGIVWFFLKLLWGEFCPAFTSWVGPESGGAGTGTGYLKETWDQASSLHSIHFRQVNFPDATTVYFHCELKVCKNSEETTCSTTELGMFCIRFLQDYHFQLHSNCKCFAKLFKNLVMQWHVEVITTVGQIHDENVNLNLIKLFLSPPKLQSEENSEFSKFKDSKNSRNSVVK